MCFPFCATSFSQYKVPFTDAKIGSPLPFAKNGFDSPRTFAYKMDALLKARIAFAGSKVITETTRAGAISWSFFKTENAHNYEFQLPSKYASYLPGGSDGALGEAGINTLGLLTGSIAMTDFYNRIYDISGKTQLEVLEQADLFITHGGMNSINEAMYYGVPMLVFPYATDQPANADRIAELGLGKRMKTSMSGERIMQSAFEVLEDKKIRSSVNEMSMKVKAYGGLEQATKLIEKYLTIINYSR